MTFCPERARAAQARRGGPPAPPPRRERRRVDADLRRPGPRHPVPASFRPVGRQFRVSAGARHRVLRRWRPDRQSTPARPAGMRAMAWMSKVVGRTRPTFADCDAHPTNVGADTRNEADDEQPPSGTTASRPYTDQLPLLLRPWMQRLPAGAGGFAGSRRPASHDLLRAHDSGGVQWRPRPRRARSPSWRS